MPLSSGSHVNLFASYPVLPKLFVQARIDNLFDDPSEPVFGYRPLGRAVYAGLRATL